MLLQILAFGINKSPKKLSRKLEPYPGRENFYHWLVFFSFSLPQSHCLVSVSVQDFWLRPSFASDGLNSGPKWVTIHFWNGNEVSLSLRALGPRPRQDMAEPGVINFSADLRAVLGHWSHVTQNRDGVTADKLQGDRLKPWEKKSLEVRSKKKNELMD